MKPKMFRKEIDYALIWYCSQPNLWHFADRLGVGQKETNPVTVNYLQTSLSRIVDRKVEITTIFLLPAYPFYGKVVCFRNVGHHDRFDCIYIFQFTLRTSGKSEDIWFESDEALINSSYDIYLVHPKVFYHSSFIIYHIH